MPCEILEEGSWLTFPLELILRITNYGLFSRFKQHRVAPYTILQLDKATQTDESCIFGIDTNVDALNDSSSNKSEKVLRQRLQRVQQRTGEHSVSSQTLSPIQSKWPLTQNQFVFCHLRYRLFIWKYHNLYSILLHYHLQIQF